MRGPEIRRISSGKRNIYSGIDNLIIRQPLSSEHWANATANSICRHVGSVGDASWVVPKNIHGARNVEGLVNIYSGSDSRLICMRIGADCVYEPKEKPGLKGGAVENLNRRVGKFPRRCQFAELTGYRKVGGSHTELARSNHYGFRGRREPSIGICAVEILRAGIEEIQ